MANTPAVITCTDVMAKEHPELVVAYMKAMIKVGRWANENSFNGTSPIASSSVCYFWPKAFDHRSLGQRPRTWQNIPFFDPPRLTAPRRS